MKVKRHLTPAESDKVLELIFLIHRGGDYPILDESGLPLPTIQDLLHDLNIDFSQFVNVEDLEDVNRVLRLETESLLCKNELSPLEHWLILNGLGVAAFTFTFWLWPELIFIHLCLQEKNPDKVYPEVFPVQF